MGNVLVSKTGAIPAHLACSVSRQRGALLLLLSILTLRGTQGSIHYQGGDIMRTPLARIAGAILALLIMGSLAGAAGAAAPQSPGPPAGSQPARPETHDRLGQIVWETVS